MSDAEQLKKLLEAYGLGALMNMIDKSAIDEAEAAITDLGGLENVMTDKLPPPPPPQPNPAFGIPDPPITAGTASYRCTEQHPPEVHGGAISDVGPLRIITRSDTLDGMSVWQIEGTFVDKQIAFHHNATVRAADLRLIRHEANSMQALFKGFVGGEWLYLRRLLSEGRPASSERVSLPHAAFASLWSLWTALAAAPLERGWSASANLYVKVGTFDWRFIPVQLDVTGEERITVRAGTFDCWIVSARGTSEKRSVDDTYWVSRGDPGTRIVARAEDRRMTGTTRFFELTELGREAEKA